MIPIGIADPNILRQLIESPSPLGLRFLWLRYSGIPNVLGFDELLEPFPKVPCPNLEMRVDLWGEPVGVDEAWLVTIKEPE